MPLRCLLEQGAGGVVPGNGYQGDGSIVGERARELSFTKFNRRQSER